MDFGAKDIVNKVPAKYDPVVYFRYDHIRNRMYLEFGRIQEELEDCYRISEQIVHKDNIFCVLTSDYYTHTLADVIRKSRNKLEKLKS